MIGYDARRGETFVVCGQGTALATATLEAYRTSGSPRAGQRTARRLRAGRVRRLAPAAARARRLPLVDVLGSRSASRVGTPRARDQLGHRQRGRAVPRALDQLRRGLPARRGVPPPGSRFADPVLAATYTWILREAEAAGDDRDVQLEAARRAWYDGSSPRRSAISRPPSRWTSPGSGTAGSPPRRTWAPGTRAWRRRPPTIPGADRVQDRPLGPGTASSSSSPCCPATTWPR